MNTTIVTLETVQLLHACLSKYKHNFEEKIIRSRKDSNRPTVLHNASFALCFALWILKIRYSVPFSVPYQPQGYRRQQIGRECSNNEAVKIGKLFCHMIFPQLSFIYCWAFACNVNVM